MPVTRFRTAAAVASVAAMLLAGACGGNDSASTSTSSTTAPATTTTTGPTTTGPTTTTGPPECGSWPKTVVGQTPTMADVERQGIFVWQDGFGWHVRVRSVGGRPTTYSGTVTGSNDFASVTNNPVVDAITTQMTANVLRFRITSGPELLGFDLIAGCPVDQMRFELKANGEDARVDEIFLGPSSKATSSTFTQQKAI